MLDTFRKGQRWLTVIFIAVIGGVFVFFLGLGGSPFTGNQPSGQAVVEAGDITVSRADYLRARQGLENRLREQLGDQFDSKGAAAFVDSQTMRQMVDSAVLADAAEDLGFMVTRSEIQDYLLQDDQFRGEDGRFAVDAFEDAVEYNFGSQRNFMAYMRQQLLQAKLRRLLYAQPIVSEAEARSAALHRLEGVRVGYVSLDTERLPPQELLTDEAIETFLAENEASVRAVYDERSDQYGRPEARRARHILFEAEETADEAALASARESAEAAMQRIVEGAAFEDVALELSQDQASRATGGDIGYVVREGETAPELEEAIYSMEPGGEMRLVQTKSGFHVVRVDETREATSMAFEEVSLELARELAGREMALEYAEATADELAEAVRDGKSLEDAAREAGVLYEQSPILRRRPDGFMPEIGTSTDLMAVAFSLSEESPSSPRVFALNTKRTLVQLIERQPPEEITLEDETFAVRDTLLTEKRNALLQTWLDQHRDSLNAKGELRIDSTIATGS